MNETKKPAVRFKGFSVEWERHPMDELTTELHEYATLDSLYPLLTSSREGIMFQNEYRSNRTTENNKTLFSIVPYGKCTYRHMSDDDIFHFNINDIVENGLVSREYPVFDSTDDNELRFIVALLNSSEQFRKFCRERKIGGTRTRLYYKDLSNFKPLCPEFNEQRNIAEFLDGITSIISYHQFAFPLIWKNRKKSRHTFLSLMLSFTNWNKNSPNSNQSKKRCWKKCLSDTGGRHGI